MTHDLYDGHWDVWTQSEVPLDGLRERYGVAPLDPALAALDDEHVRRADFERPGMAPPPHLVGPDHRPPDRGSAPAGALVID